MSRRALLFSIVGLLALLGLLAELGQEFFPSPIVRALVGLFSLSYEGNIPNWYSSCLLFWCGLSLARISAGLWKRHDAFRWHWILLAGGFFYMSLDEAVGIHENFGGITQVGGLLYYDWILPASMLILILALFYWPFLRSLPSKARRDFLFAAALFLGGAVAMELPLGYWADRFGVDNFGYAAIDLVEETLELLGLTVFLLGLEDHWRRLTAIEGVPR